jgi:excisionase family DNA binding protein
MGEKSAAREVQVRGILPEKIVISTVLDPYLSLKALASYSGLSVRTLRTYLEKSPAEALPCYRVGGKLLVRRSEFDAWMAQYRAQGRPSLARAMRELGLS